MNDMNVLISQLQQAKRHSDLRQYDAKSVLLRTLMQRYPEEFIVDSELNRFVGITHTPTNFRFHIPKTDLPATFRGYEYHSGPSHPALEAAISDKPVKETQP